jgi:uncharacterized protein (TIGR02444 family)
VQDLGQLSSSRFWAFSLKVYGDKDVAASCIDLQDRHGLDVNMLLFALFAAAHGRSLSPADMLALESAVKPWRTNVVRPLRSVRRWLKERSHGDDAAATLRHAVLEREIESEAYQQALIERTVPIGDGRPDARAAAENLVRYAQCASMAVDDRLLAGLATLLARTFDLSEPAATAAISGIAARTG